MVDPELTAVCYFTYVMRLFAYSRMRTGSRRHARAHKASLPEEEKPRVHVLLRNAELHIGRLD